MLKTMETKNSVGPGDTERVHFASAVLTEIRFVEMLLLTNAPSINALNLQLTV